MACVRERLRKGDIEGARKARAQAALKFEEAKENRDAELAVGIRDLLNTSARLLLSSCLSAFVGAMTCFSAGIRGGY